MQNGAQIQFRAAKSIYKGQNIAIATGAGYCGPDDTHGRRRGLDWDAVESIVPVDAAEPFVYDLEVDVVHNFVTNDIISHNSQILRYMSDLAPRGIYASGKSSSAAGLCVAPDSKILVDGKQVERVVLSACGHHNRAEAAPEAASRRPQPHHTGMSLGIGRR